MLQKRLLARGHQGYVHALKNPPYYNYVFVIIYSFGWKLTATQNTGKKTKTSSHLKYYLESDPEAII